MAWVAVLMGSESDWATMQACTEALGGLGVEFEVRVTSAHRTPAATAQYVSDASSRGCGVFICAAGLAAHLAGAVAAHTTRPVIGVPMDGGPLNGADALLSTVMMPGGVPVATVAIGKAGARNAGYLAAQILAVADEDLAARVEADRAANAAKVAAQNESVQETLR
ncbi:MAG: 5-(carboxyamino)imidazole ribonucleotide mutase [Gammaproteobacteria bacterium]|nr:5-(carboxyamino)imidazole ribonucleotide mutase [Gammaproteobacteria bacterium]